MNEADYRALISGKTRGLLAAAARLGLQMLTGPYALGVFARNRAFDLGWKKIEKADVPVISLGNLTTGGTGKTPLAAFVARWFRERDVRVAFLSRGYGAKEGGMNDEALVLDLLCPDVPHLQNADRVASARIAVEELDSQLLILDDGFQHRRLARDLDIVLIDALNPWGYGHQLPRGLLRESISSLRRADVVLLTRADQCTAAARQEILARIAQVRKSDACVGLSFPPRQLCDAEGKMAAIDSLKGRHVAAFCGIGNPSAFRQSLEQMGVIIDDFKTFRDHHPYTRDDVDDLRQWAGNSHAKAIITTQKDLVKIGLTELADRPLWSVEIGVAVLNNAHLLESHFEKILQKIPPN